MFPPSIVYPSSVHSNPLLRSQYFRLCSKISSFVHSIFLLLFIIFPTPIIVFTSFKHNICTSVQRYFPFARSNASSMHNISAFIHNTSASVRSKNLSIVLPLPLIISSAHYPFVSSFHRISISVHGISKSFQKISLSIPNISLSFHSYFLFVYGYPHH